MTIRKTILSTILGLSLALGGSYLMHKHQSNRDLKEASRIFSLEDHYVPVGNGGAAAEARGDISPARKEMYQRIDNARENYLKNPSETLSRYYKRLRNEKYKRSLESELERLNSD